ncbi:host specificity factor TipJ family phage tail protein [Pseudoxanthomonas kalamensis]|uniref:host specificity factor TipJ family phage tail protein n=1 Tax=Pseudoxanthomonas kalamensis TaxID=289483 RepID=UPI00139130A1|nr:host specificity factor TipJ family phage tail protein [Pseudoxanthomonas kalamensis]
MSDPTSGAPIVLTPHPITLEGQRHMVAALEDGEKLGGFLRRVVPNWTDDAWEVRINGVIVPHEVLERVRPKDTALIEVRGIVKKQVLAIVAIAALAYFTMGAGATWAAGLGAVGSSLAYTVAFAAGSALINKVLMPKPSAPAAITADPVYSVGLANNTARPYEPLPLLLGTTRITPDLASAPYTWFEGDDQYLGMVLTPGVNVHSIGDIYNGDTLLSSYEGVTVYLSGFGGHPDQDIPLYSNADTVDGGELDREGTWVERTTPADTVRVQINIEYVLGDVTSKGKPYNNKETIAVEYRATGAPSWSPLTSRTVVNNNYKQTKRLTISSDLPAGQYDIRVHRLGLDTNARNSVADFSWNTMTSVQADDTDYTGIQRIGIKIKATGQLNGALNSIRMVANSIPVPVWDGLGWTTEQTSNPGAHLLAYARGLYDSNGRLLLGIGLSDSMIDIEGLKAFMVHCGSNGYTYDAYIKDQRNHLEMCDAIALAGFGQVSWAGGKFGAVWADSAQPLTGVVNMATMKKSSFQVDYTLANAADGIEYSYVDAATWETKTLRVEAPGVAIMQNPARISGEGITSEAHAAKMARYHLGQSLYQHKDISYSTDLEHLTYRRMSLLSLSHDMTQWGYGGRVMAASIDGSDIVTLTLDEPVPAPDSGTAYVGLRIPGEGAYRVFEVASFVGETDTLTLAEAWPGDAALPGDDADNPAHDTLWTYDFKATPGLRVRVVQIEPETGMTGGRIVVVPESAEFWEYVETGAYTPPSNTSLLQSRPELSDLIIDEFQTVQGDTVFTELQATFTVTGKMAYCTAHIAQQLDGEWTDLEKVAESRTGSIRFRIPSAGVYQVVIRPYDDNGIVGGVVSTTYTTEGADIAPPMFENFSVTALAGGVRKYTWSYDSEETVQPADLAGAEIRYLSGTHATPDWESMTPVGDDGYHTAAFEAVVPAAGTWTFACRARNTSGALGAAKVITTTLTGNLGEQLVSITDEQVALQAAIDAEAASRVSGDAAAEAAAAAAQAHSEAVAAQVADITGADDWSGSETYPIGDLVKYGSGLYRALTENTNKQPDTNPSDWQYIGNYSSLGEATAAAVSMSTVNASDIASEAAQLDAVQARMPGGSEVLATSAEVASEASARAAADSALASDISTVSASAAANEAAIIAEESARVSETGALATDITTLQTTVGDQSSSITQLAMVQAGTAGVDLRNRSFEDDSGWHSSTSGTGGLPSGVTYNTAAAKSGARVLRFSGVSTVAYNAGRTSVRVGEKISLGMFPRKIGSAPSAGARIRFGCRGYDLDGNYVSGSSSAPVNVLMDDRSFAFQDDPDTGIYTVPDGVSEIGYHLQTTDLASGAIAVDDVFVERLSTSDERSRAIVGMYLDVNDKIAGYRTENDGTTSAFDILADVFRVTGGSTEGMEWRDGYLRVYGSGYQRIIGSDFGVSGQELVDYFGPNVGAASASKANAVMWMDKSGDAYWGGSLSAGVLYNSNTASFIGNGTGTLGPFGTNGGSKSVVVSMQVNASGWLAGDVASTYDGQSISATVTVERSTNGGSSWTSIGSFVVSGSKSATYEASESATSISYGMSGSTTITDTNASTSDFMYRAVVSGASNYPMTLRVNPASGTPTTQGTQRLTIASTEE